MDENFIEFCAIGKSYDPARPIVKDFNLRIREGEFVSIIGHSGCGKSTVLSIAMGLNKATQGSFILAGRETDEPGTDRGVVFQSPALLPWFTARENVLLALEQKNSVGDYESRRRAAGEHLSNVGLLDMAEVYPSELSSGMRQRVGIARAFALEPKVLLLDEPFSLLDALTRMELQEELIRLWDKHRKTVIMVTHDVDEALFLSDRIVMMTCGPGATIGQILPVHFPRPRTRADVLAHPEYFHLRDRLITFLEEQAEKSAPVQSVPPEKLQTPYNVDQVTGRVVMIPVLDMEVT